MPLAFLESVLTRRLWAFLASCRAGLSRWALRLRHWVRGLSPAERKLAWVALSLTAALLLLPVFRHAHSPLRVWYAKGLYGLASRHMQRQRYVRALPLLQASTHAYPDLAIAHSDQGVIYDRWDRREQGRNAYWKAIAADPSFAAAYNNLGVSYLESGHLEAARRLLQEAVALDPENSAAWTNLGVAEQRADRPEQAIRAYRAALRLGPDNALVLANLGTLYYQRGQPAEAREHFDAALQIDPEFAEPRALLGLMALLNGDLVRAEGELRRAAVGLEDDPVFHFYLAQYYEKTGRPELALSELASVLALHPDPWLFDLADSYQEALASSTSSLFAEALKPSSE